MDLCTPNFEVLAPTVFETLEGYSSKTVGAIAFQSFIFGIFKPYLWAEFCPIVFESEHKEVAAKDFLYKKFELSSSNGFRNSDVQSFLWAKV